MKVCYFIQSHKNPEQVYRLVRIIKRSSPNAQVLIGYDFTNSYLDMTPLRDLPEVDLLRGSFPVKRGDFSALQPYLNAINWLVEHNSDFDWLVYLSGQDYPVQPIPKIEDFLSKTEYDGFIEHYDVLSDESPWSIDDSLNRYFCNYYRFPEWTREFMYKLTRLRKFTPLRFHFIYGVLVGVVVRRPPFNEKFSCYGGNHRHFLSRKCVQFLKDFIDNNPELVNYYKKTILPEESFVQTILANSKQFKLSKDYKIYDDYSQDLDGHPKIITIEDYLTITKGSFFFARKFEQDAQILDLIDTKIHQVKLET